MKYFRLISKDYKYLVHLKIYAMTDDLASNAITEDWKETTEEEYLLQEEKNTLETKNEIKQIIVDNINEDATNASDVADLIYKFIYHKLYNDYYVGD